MATVEDRTRDRWSRLIAGAYTLANLAGAFYVWRNYREARKDLEALLATGRDGDARAAAELAIRSEVVRLLELGASITIGLVATADPRSTEQSLVKRLALSALLFGYPIGITYNARTAEEFRQRFMSESKAARHELER